MSDDKEVQGLEEALGGYKSKVATTFKGSIKWDKELIFVARTQKGYEIDYDANVQWGCQPSEPFMLSLGACIATDTVMFLQKMKVEITDFKLDITGIKEREEPPHYFTGFDVMINITGKNISDNKMKRALALSRDKYCGIYHSLRSDVTLNVEYTINDEA